MGLNWDLSKVENFRETCFIRLRRSECGAEDLARWDEYANNGMYHHSIDDEGKEDKDTLVRMKAETDTIIWYLWFTETGKITKKNFEEVFRRIYVYETVTKPMMTQGREPVRVTYRDVREHIGLSVNVVWSKEGVFKKKMWTQMQDEARRAMLRGRSDWDKEERDATEKSDNPCEPA